MAKLHQVIVRNTPDKGLDVVATTLDKSQTHDISLFLPEEQPSDFSGVYLTKFQHSSGNVMLRFTFDDGIDQFGRETIKTHTLIIDNAFYNEKTAQYFISPLINGLMFESNSILKLEDFDQIEIYPISSKLIELVFTKKHVQLTSQRKIHTNDLIQIFGTVDRIIPPPLNNSFSFQTFVSSNRKKGHKKRSLTFSSKKLRWSQSIEYVQQSNSEFLTLQILTDAISELSALRQLQKQLFLRIPEKRLRLKMHWRFGIKTFFQIRENLGNHF